MIVYLKRVENLDCRPTHGERSIVARWVARDWEQARVGIGRTRVEAERNMQPLGKAVTSSKFINQFLAASHIRYVPPVERSFAT